MKKKPKTVSKLKHEADAIFSKYIRNKYAKDGYISCVTCGLSKPITEMQAGHYISRSCNALRFDERNVFPQCYGCNVGRGGNYPKFTIYLLQRFGQDHLTQLDEDSKILKQF